MQLTENELFDEASLRSAKFEVATSNEKIQLQET